MVRHAAAAAVIAAKFLLGAPTDSGAVPRDGAVLEPPSLQEIPPFDGDASAVSKEDDTELKHQRRAFRKLPFSAKSYTTCNGTLNEQDMQSFCSAGYFLWRRGEKEPEVLMAWEDRGNDIRGSGPTDCKSRLNVLMMRKWKPPPEAPKLVLYTSIPASSPEAFCALVELVPLQRTFEGSERASQNEAEQSAAEMAMTFLESQQDAAVPAGARCMHCIPVRRYDFMCRCWCCF